jgi:alkanesulfonate monooxygenase SsuD/methylene tetrahydromethanopterin reductase-like flavin-dependent oxidoreductase (luciferase family)
VKYDIFFSISQTPVDGHMPPEAEMFRSFFAQVEAADALGYGTAWVAESHLSSEVQKRSAAPVIPHWKGEVGLNTDILQLAARVFARTQRIEVGSAVMNIVCNGGPIAHAERIGAFLALHGLDPDERRRIRIGFSAGRFQFMNRAYGIVPRDEMERVAWPALRGQVFAEACEIFLRLLRGETLSSDDIRETVLTRANFRSDEHWQQVCEAAEVLGSLDGESVRVPRRWVFEHLKIVPQDFRRDLLDLVIGSHDPRLQADVNAYLPVKVFNLSITRPDIIEATHSRMAETYNKDGGDWQRGYMPRTVMVFLNEQPGLSTEEKRAAAAKEANAALGAYWTALQGTLDPNRVEQAAGNAVIGDAEEVARQIIERFHPDDRLMLWFDFFNHDSERVIANMTAFMELVVPRVEAAL